MADWPYNTAQWQRVRRAHLARFPLCEDCKTAGFIRVANTVDHRIPISAGGHPFPGHDGLASYCPSCHGAKTARGVEAGAVRTNKPRRGCDASGMPLDPAHDWSTKSLRPERLRPTSEVNPELVRYGEEDDHG
ncbi:MAG: HNH endonuclease [Sphingobium sp.]|nr:HNH endonuclease [Sphingobium sp.]